MTIVEVAVAFGIFSLAASGVVASLIQARKFSESNLAQSYAHATAQGIIEEVVRVPPTLLSDPDLTEIEIKLARLTSSNHTEIEAVSLPWAADDTDFTEIGTTSAGILTDAAYLADSQKIRPERFMRMKLNLRREIEADQNRVRIVLRYQWEIPDRKNTDGTPLFLSGEIRTVRSTALRF